MVKFLHLVYRILPKHLKILIQQTKINFILYSIYSYLLSKNQLFYSQTGEDKLLIKYFPESKGMYIDVGAGQPVRGSNTFYFYKLGWRGYLIEPLKFNQKLIKLFRKEDITLQGIITNQTDVLSFYEFYPGEYSTTVESNSKDLVKRGIALKDTYKVRGFPLSDLEIDMRPLEPTFVSIDVEGMDLDVLRSNDWNRIIPRVICVEESPPTLSGSDISNYLSNYGYKFQETTGLSSIYVHNTYLNS